MNRFFTARSKLRKILITLLSRLKFRIGLPGQFHQCSTSAFFARVSQKAKKGQSSCQSFFLLSRSLRVKAACIMLMKLTPGADAINISGLLYSLGV